MAEIPWIDLAVQDGTTLTRTITVKTTDSEGVEHIQNLTDCTLRFRVFLPEGSEVFAKALSIPSPASGEGFLVVVPTEYASIEAGTVYMHDVRLTDSAGGVSPVMQGGFSRIAD
jgi:hypothetical protein